MVIRYLKILLAFGVASWGLLGGLGNLAGYSDGMEAVRAVLSMEALENRPFAIENEIVTTLGFAFIWVSKLIGGALCLYGGYQMWCCRALDAGSFAKSKDMAIAGCGTIFIMLFLGFNLISTNIFMVFLSPLVAATELSWVFAGEIGIIMLFLHMNDR